MLKRWRCESEAVRWALRDVEYRGRFMVAKFSHALDKLRSGLQHDESTGPFKASQSRLCVPRPYFPDSPEISDVDCAFIHV